MWENVLARFQPGGTYVSMSSEEFNLLLSCEKKESRDQERVGSLKVIVTER